jgi:hypothetical protein
MKYANFEFSQLKNSQLAPPPPILSFNSLKQTGSISPSADAAALVRENDIIPAIRGAFAARMIQKSGVSRANSGGGEYAHEKNNLYT